MLNNVKWIKFSSLGDNEKEIPIIWRISKEDLINCMKKKAYPVPEVGEDEELVLAYVAEDDSEVRIDLVNMTSDVPDECYSFETDAEVFIASIEDDHDYVGDYCDARLYAENEGIHLMQSEYLKDVRK